MAKNFALIGVGGFIAPRHLEAIKANGGTLVAAFDVNDSVGIMDRYFPDCRFFTKFEQFEAFIEKWQLTQPPIEYTSICTPNYLHSAHIKTALRHGTHVICEKPLVLTVTEIDELGEYEKRFDRQVFTVLQLRVHDAIIALKKKIDAEARNDHKIDLTYLTSRGQWYHESWKGDVNKSGGLSTNIGIHFFDMLTWVFGAAKDIRLEQKSPTLEKGQLLLEKATVNWFLSIDRAQLPAEAVNAGKTTFRSIRIDGHEFEFSEGFTELHNRVYADILAGRGYGLSHAKRSVEIAERLRGL